MKIIDVDLYEKLKIKPATIDVFYLKPRLRPFDIVETLNKDLFMFFKGEECLDVLKQKLNKKYGAQKYIPCLVGREYVILNKGMFYARVGSQPHYFINIDQYDGYLRFNGFKEHQLTITKIWHTNDSYLPDFDNLNYETFIDQIDLHNLLEFDEYNKNYIKNENI